MVFEIASKTTYRKDDRIKAGLYQRLGVQEYFQYDPVGDCFQPRLRGQLKYYSYKMISRRFATLFYYRSQTPFAPATVCNQRFSYPYNQ
jgi:hypothetical protein